MKFTILDIEADSDTQLNLYGELLESCGATEEYTEAYASLEELRALDLILEDEIKNKPTPDLGILRAVKSRLNQLQTKLIGIRGIYDSASRLYSNLDRLIDDIEEERDLTNSKEKVLFNLDSMDEKLYAAEEESVANCVPTGEFKFRVVIVRIPDLTPTFTSEDTSKISLEDVFRVEIARDEVRLQESSKATFDVVVYNTGQVRRDFDITALGLTESWLSGLASFSLDPGYSKVTTITVRPPRGLTGSFTGDKGVILKIESYPYSLTREIAVNIGKYGVSINVPEKIQVRPEIDTLLPVQVSNNGDVEDDYKVDVSGETWVTFPNNVTLGPRETAQLNITVNPPKTARGSYYFEIEVNSIEYTEISDSEKIKVTVSAEDVEIQDEIDDLKNEYYILKDEYGDIRQVSLILSAIEEAEDNLELGNIDAAKVDARRASELIQDLKLNPPSGLPIWIYLLVLIVPVAGYLIAKQMQGGESQPYSQSRFSSRMVPLKPIHKR